MRKLLLSLIAFAFVVATPVSASLFQYYQERGEALPSITERAETAAEVGIWGYKGTKEQNILLEERLRELTGNPGELGISVVSRYKTTLLSSMTSNQTTIPVASLETFDGDTLTMDTLGGVVYITIEPGLAREEIIKCTAITDGRFSSCTRGLKFSGTDESGDADNRYAHNSGSVVVMSNVHYVYENFLDKNEASTLYGLVTFNVPPISTTTATTTYQIPNWGQVTSTLAGYPTLAGNNAFSGTNSFSNTSSFTGTTNVPYSTASSSAASVGFVNDTTNAGAAIMSTTTAGIAKLSVDPVSSVNPIVVGDNDNRLLGGFGGDGSDGALSVSSGTTTIDLLGERVVTKNYTSISITGTGAVNFSNPHSEGTIIVLKSQGNTTLTSSATPMIDARNTGAAGGASASASSGTTAGSAGTAGKTYGFVTTVNGGAADGSNPGGAGSAYTFGFFGGITSSINQITAKYPRVFVGSGGGSGSLVITSGSGASTSGKGGNGGGALIIECAGAWNFTTSNGISVSGENGGNASVNPSVNNGGAGGGGGGGAGFFTALYNSLTANTGSVTASGGTGGNASIVNTGTGRGGGGGGSIGAGNGGSSSSSNNAKTGGDGGATGFTLIAKNNEF